MIGETIKKMRENQDITQQELADRLSLSRSALSLYEINAREPDLATLAKFADYFGVSIDYLIGREKPSPNEEGFSRNTLEFANLFDQLNEDTQKKLLELARLYLSVPENLKDK